MRNVISIPDWPADPSCDDSEAEGQPEANGNQTNEKNSKTQELNFVKCVESRKSQSVMYRR
jgi:hypothetical protein